LIARFTIELPYAFNEAQDGDLPPYEYERPPHRVRIYPPTHEEKQKGRTVNVLQIDFLRETFERNIEAPLDPPYTLAVEVANRFLAQLRMLTRRSYLKPLKPDEVQWRMSYLTDDGEPLPEAQGLRLGEYGRSISWRPLLLDGAWSVLPALPPDYTPPLWDVLLLDADALPPEIGPALVAANTALETFITWALDELAALASVPTDLWQWVNDRPDWRQEPSVSERFDELLRITTGKSLKEEKQLWEGFQQLRSVRNSFAHEGQSLVGRKKGKRGKRGQPGRTVTLQEAQQMIGHANAIITWVEAFLPEEKRRPKAQSRPGGGMVFHVPLY
jgi:hypothetical protein